MHGLLFLAAMQAPLPMPAGPVQDGWQPDHRRLAYDDERKVTTADLAMMRMLITSPAGEKDSVPSADEWPRVSAAFHQTAVAMELLDPAERVYIGADAKDWQLDLNTIRDRWVAIGDAPMIGEANRFTFSRTDCGEAVYFIRAVRDRIERRMEIETDRRHELRDAISLVDEHFFVWDALRDSKCEYYHVPARRVALQRLKRLVGPDLWATGGMPPPVPVELFREMP